jgi:16S rRNA (guanine1207-N2)-methyltransferase
MESKSPPIRIAEALALEVAWSIGGERILCTMLGRAQAAYELAASRSTARVACWFLDDYQRRVAQSECGLLANLTLFLGADAPMDAIDFAVVPLATGGEAELARDLIQSAWQRLATGGTLVTAVDNPHDRWVREQLRAWFDKVRVAPHEDAVAYVARKDAAPRKVKDFRCEFAFRDRLVRAVSRPGVFSHRRIDPGARRLVLDMGCGSGVVGLALAARDLSIRVHAIDSHARAVECTQAGAALNGLSNVSVELDATSDVGRLAEFDQAVLNPPYYGDYAIAERFLDAAWTALKPGGQAQVVTKAPDWYRAVMPSRWADVEVRESKSYWIVSAGRP